MGILSKADWQGAGVGLGFVWALFHGLVLRKVFQITREVVSDRRHSSVGIAEDTGICSCIFKRADSFQLSKNFTLASITCFFLCNVVGISHHALYFCLCDACTVRTSLWILSAVFSMLGFTLTYAAHFERLRLTFSGTPMQLPQWAPKVMYGVCLLFFLLTIGIAVARFSQPKVASVCVFLAIVVYFTGVSFLTRVFFKKTTAAANTTPPDTLLLEVAVRITVVAAVSVLGTVVSSVVAALLLGLCPMCYFWLTVSNALFDASKCLNSFCLMCAFSGAVAPYKRVFGRLHNALLSYVSKTLTMSSAKLQVLSRTRSATENPDDTKSRDVGSSDACGHL